MPRFVPPLVVLLGVLVLGAAPPSSSLQLVLHGVIADPGGGPVSGASVVVRSERRTTVSTDRKGAFSVRVPLPTPEQLRAAPCTVQVFATARRMRTVTASGDASLTFAFALEGQAEGGGKVVVRANDMRLAALAAGVVAAGRGVATADTVRFRALDGERIGDPPLARTPHVVQMAIAAASATPSPSPAAAVATPAPVAAAPPASSPAATSRGASRDAGDVTVPTAPPKTTVAAAPTRPATTPKSQATTTAPKSQATTTTTKSQVTTTPPKSQATTKNTPPTPAATSAAAAPSRTRPGTIAITDGGVPSPPPITPRADSTCACRIRGTIELVMNPPPTEPVGVALWVADAPAIRDSVVLALGPPRAFELLGLPCGTHRLVVRSSARRPHVVAQPTNLDMPCAAGQLLQPRVVLRPK
jgi:hypothetical protein